MFKKILIANRGEIACRIARSCRRLGVAVAGVHSTADRDSLHVREIGQSVEIGGAPAAESYLRLERVIEAAKSAGAQAIHPAFGFLAENAAFARAVEAAGLAFVGPTPEVIERLGDKALAKREAITAGVPVVPGSEGASDDPALIAQIVRGLQLPVMLKAAAGGGGKGMRALHTLDGLDAEIESAMREARNSFGSPALIVEQMIENARHIEVQIVGDGLGKVLHLFERECTLQRRHQKLVEEAPAAPLAPGVRERLLADAVRLGQQLKYRNVGTVEFIVQGERYYFLEVNPRLQVEHPVTEEVTGLDVVELMLRIASGEGLALEQAHVRVNGHAVETRICAEDPAAGFRPSTGLLSYVRYPDRGVRVETGVDSGSEVTPWYDPMIAKLITHAPTRDQAMDRMQVALDETCVFGVVTNRDFLKLLLSLKETRDASFHTRLIDEQIAFWPLARDSGQRRSLAVAAYTWLMGQRAAPACGVWSAGALTGWQMSDGSDGLAPIPALYLRSATGSAGIRFAPLAADGTLRLAVDGEVMELSLRALGEDRHLATFGAHRHNVRVVQDGSALYVQDDHGTHNFVAQPYLSYVSAVSQASGELRAPMMGMILKVNVQPGEVVKAGDVVAVLESMKMEMRICAEADGVIESLHCEAGQTVERNAVVVRLGKAA